jgi:histone deacetylase complex subunit SAP18
MGTRLDFELVYPDLRAPPRSDGSGRYQRKPFGSIVLGAGGSSINGVKDDDDPAATAEERRRNNALASGDEDKSLADAKFVIGDYISCAIFPPLANGDVAPAPRATAGILGASGARGGPPPRENGYGGPQSLFGRGQRGGAMRGGGGFDNVPAGEWRRGDPLPSNSGGGGGGYRGRGRSRGW